jgi:hypothetical protein
VTTMRVPSSLGCGNAGVCPLLPLGRCRLFPNGMRGVSRKFRDSMAVVQGMEPETRRERVLGA